VFGLSRTTHTCRLRTERTVNFTFCSSKPNRSGRQATHVHRILNIKTIGSSNRNFFISQHPTCFTNLPHFCHHLPVLKRFLSSQLHTSSTRTSRFFLCQSPLTSRYHYSLLTRASEPLFREYFNPPILPLFLPNQTLDSHPNFYLWLLSTAMTDYLEFKTNPKMEYRRCVCGTSVRKPSSIVEP
jgi:hypothetical protein